MQDINFQKIRGNGPDEVASTGLELVQAFNGNFDIVKEALKNSGGQQFSDLPIATMTELDNIRSGSYRVLLSVSGGKEIFYLLCSVDPDGTTVRQTKIAECVYIRSFNNNAWSQWKNFQEAIFQSELGDGIDCGISQKFFTDTIGDKTLFIDLGIIDSSLSLLDSIDNAGFYTYNLSSDENENISGLLIVSKVSFPGTFNFTQVRFELDRIYIREFDVDERTWGQWYDFRNDLFKSELGNRGDRGISQKFLTDFLGSEETSEGEDGSVWGKLISLEAYIAETLMDIVKNSSARFDEITDASVVIDGITTATDGKVVYVAKKKTFAYLVAGKYYKSWIGMGYYLASDYKVLTDKIYLCKDKAYVFHDGDLHVASGITTFQDAQARGYKGTEIDFYKNLSNIDILKFHNKITYEEIDSVVSCGVYIVEDDYSYSSDILIVSRYGEEDAVTQLFLSCHFGGGMPRTRSLTGSSWSEWEELCSQRDIKNLQSDIDHNAPARFDRIVIDRSIVIEGGTDAAGGEVVFVATKNRFAYLLNDRYYESWPGVEKFIGTDRKVIADKVYVCGNSAYVFFDGALRDVGEQAIGIATTAEATANEALNKVKGVVSMKSVLIDQLDALITPSETAYYYAVKYNNNPVGTLRVFSNSTSSIVTQILDANWDIDVSGNLLPDYEAVELKSFIRTYNISSEGMAGEIPVGTWGKWKLNQKVIAPQGGIIIE